MALHLFITSGIELLFQGDAKGSVRSPLAIGMLPMAEFGERLHRELQVMNLQSEFRQNLCFGPDRARLA
jgi:hypothetical protein